jgi:site-specific recombinase XerD
VDLDTALTAFLYAKDHTEQTRIWYTRRLKAFLSWAEQQGVHTVSELSVGLIDDYLAYRRSPNGRQRGEGKLSTHTLHGYARAIKAFIFWAGRRKQLPKDLGQEIVMPRREEKVIQTLTPHQFDRLFTAADLGETLEYINRDKAILALLLDTGIRANELCTLAKKNVHFLTDGAYALVYGKGRREREVPLGKKSRLLLHRYLHVYRPPVDREEVFIAKGGTPLTPEGLDRLLYRLRDRAGREHFSGVRVSAHVLRHSYAVFSLEAGMDLMRLSRLMGHSSVTTTEIYLKTYTSRQARTSSISVLDHL